MSRIQEVVIKNGIIGFKPNALPGTVVTITQLSLQDLICDYGLIIPISTRYSDVVRSVVGPDSVKIEEPYILITPDLKLFTKTAVSRKINILPLTNTVGYVNSNNFDALTMLSFGLKILPSAKEIIEVYIKAEEFSEIINDFIFLTFDDLKKLFKGKVFKEAILSNCGEYLLP